MERSLSEAMYIVIPTTVAQRDDITRSAVLLYGFLGALANATGYCFATNAYLTELMACGETTLKRLLGELKSAGLIAVEILFRENGSVQERRITLKSPISAQAEEATEPEKSRTHAYGSQKNVFLNEDNYRSLKMMYPDLDETIEDMSLYLAKNNKRYKNCYAALLQWYRKRAKEQPKKGSRWDGVDY